MESRPLRKLFFVGPARVPQTPGQNRPDGRHGMDAAIYDCPAEWWRFLPPGTRQIRQTGELAEHIWPLLALTPEGCRALEQTGAGVVCRLLLAPGDRPALLGQVRAETVISYGLSPRDSLTLSSLAEPVLCVQRALPRPDGAVVDPQEFPLPLLPGPAEALLPLLGLWLLQIPPAAEGGNVKSRFPP